MSNETKRDVFEVAMNHATKSGWVDYSEMMSRYDAALPDDMPAIPEAVGNQIVEDQGEHLSDELHWAAQGALGDRELSNWIADNEDTFALAWVLGIWRVEETGEIVKLEAEVRDEKD
ncbi:hypothetical protein [Lacticaseibacillus parakribbianus]|uniref:hypothetical protein n=1 Tax=Lacticaseibacillus parakribbianus TaxID=2970927 RepID=UPI0021CB3DA2|nr:hypothetical protein [Lacticaseibacillus parakribbianus]